MDQLEVTIQKHVENFCKILPSHVEKWKVLLQKAENPVQALCNYAEQLQQVQKANITYLEDFDAVQKALEYKIFEGIECEINTLKIIVEQLNATNHETRNKLSLLERSTIDLNWDNDTQLLKGNALQPPLSRILQEALNFWLYFAEPMKTINIHIKNLNICDAKSMTEFENCFKLDLEHKTVRCLLAITQYVNNEKLLV